VLARAVHLLDAFHAEDHRVSLATLVQRTGLPKSTVHRMLGDLVALRLVERGADGYRTITEEVGRRTIRGTVRLATTKTRLRNGVRFDLVATVAGRRLTEPTRVVVRNGGRVRATGIMREGQLRLRVTGLPRGQRTLWFYIAPTSQSVNKIVSRRAWFR